MALCDSCDSKIVGERFKCTACQDFDYCAGCYQDAELIHPGHDFKTIECEPAGSSSCDDSNCSGSSGNPQTRTPTRCRSCFPLSYGLPTLYLIYEQFQEDHRRKLEEGMTKNITDDTIPEDPELREKIAAELYHRTEQQIPMDFEHFKKIPWDKIYKQNEALYIAENGPVQGNDDTIEHEDMRRLGIGVAEALMESLGSYAPISHMEYQNEEEDESAPQHKKQFPLPSLTWAVRISRLVEASQRGCEFCSFFLNKVFVTTYFSCPADIYGSGLKNSWYTNPGGNSARREKAISDCMQKLTKLKHDSFLFAVFPICSKKDSKLPDFNKLQFGLIETADDHDVVKEILKYSEIWMTKGQGPNMMEFQVNVYTTKAAIGLSSRTPNASPGSDNAFNLINEWTTYCNENHKDTCLRSSGFQSDLPRRVIDISNGQSLKLYEPPRGEKGIYTALSYCWGGSQAFQTTISTLDAMRLGFEMSMLPKTMRDAILVTQKLGVKYIWIDCLCIIQDIPSDKSYEFSQMAKTYKGSYLTICATRAGSVDEGFLIDMADKSTGLWKGLIPLAYRLPDSTATTIEEAASLPGSQMGKIWLHDDYDDWQTSFTFPTTRRGWCLQEQLLSPRFLSYGRWPTFRCRKSTFADGGYYYSPASIRDATETLENRMVDMLFDSPQSSNLSSGLDMFSTTQLYQAWYAFIHDYSRREIGRPCDRLPAIGGIAAEVSRLTGHRYLAGLWQDNILHDLMWFTKVHELSRQTQQWRAPSWSWASVDCTVSYGNITADSKPMATVRKCTVILTDSSSPFGEVSEASLEIKGLFTELKTKNVNDLLKKQSRAPIRRKNGDGAEWHKLMTRHGIDVHGANVVNRETHEIKEDPPLEGQVYGLIMFTRDWRLDQKGNKVNELCYSGLFLQKAKDSLGYLKRVGSFANEAEPWLDQKLNPWKEKSVVIV
ncbi:uncharacterized protein N7496_002851 [Penicillium cataractarum]|uniref:ZZ-type domain-containing protein n=1 Tax=Penicillium cataractarum TaxID=2100454 RepID=A0A9W9VFM4_9EURO|nr:uncharacterized protein N7496_002851 [Penicillium cataractarum]KAJ5380423.1 hypothetical protein N7496_002851 [Penicillium cataractarum]